MENNFNIIPRMRSFSDTRIYMFGKVFTRYTNDAVWLQTIDSIHKHIYRDLIDIVQGLSDEY
jgi:hypothetical protein